MDGLGDYIRTRRELLGMTQKEVAAKVGTSPAYLAQIERGNPKLPNADLRRALAAALGLRHVDLLIAAGELRDYEVADGYLFGDVEADELVALYNLMSGDDRERLVAIAHALRRIE